MRRILSLLLVLSLCLGMVPGNVWAEEVTEEPTEITEETEVWEETTQPEETETEPENEATEEAAVPEETEVTEATEGTTVPEGTELPGETEAEETEPEIAETEAVEETEEYQGNVVAFGTCGDNLTWTLDEDGLLTISGTGAMTDYDFYSHSRAPWYGMGAKTLKLEPGITHIGSYAFYYMDLSEEIYIPEGVKSIGEEAFASDGEITSLHLPETLETIGKRAFYFVGITSLHIPASVEAIGEDAFTGHNKFLGGSISVDAQNKNFVVKDGCLYSVDMTRLLLICGGTVEEVRIPDSVTYVDDEVFGNASALKSIHIGAGVTGFSVNKNPFQCCNKLVSVTVSQANANYYAIDNVLFSADNVLLSYLPSKTDLNYSVPTGTKALGQQSFYSNPCLRKLVIPEGVKKIGIQAASWCGNLKLVVIPKSVTEIGEEALGYWNWDEKIDGLTIQGYPGSAAEQYAEENGFPFISMDFEYAKEGVCGDNLSWKLDESGTLTISGTGPMYDYENDCPWSELEPRRLILEEGITYIGDRSFLDCESLTGGLVLPESLKGIGRFAFRRCGFTSVEMFDSVESIKMGAFVECNNISRVIYHGNREQWNAISIDAGNDSLLNANFVGDQGYTISFDGNGAEIGSMRNLETAVDVVVTLPDASFINPGYTFTGWNSKADGKGKSYQPGAQVKNLAEEGTVTLYAQWRPSTYTARFLPGAEDCKGSVKDMPNLLNGESYAFPKCGYTRMGYLFAGWGVERADDLIWNAGDKLKMTRVEEGYVAEFVARWTPNTYTIHFTPNGGTGKMPDQKGILYGEAVELPSCAFTRKGYRFTGWNTKANGTGETVEEALNLTAANNGTVTLYAQWEGEAYEVTFHFGEETYTQTLHYGTAETLAPNSFENPGYTFKGWNTKETGKGKSYKDGAKVANLADTDLYAQWIANKYTVIFHSNLAKDTVKKQTLTYDAKETALTANSFSWKGHAFQGWTTEDGRTFANKEKVRNLTTEQTVDLYAIWKVNEYTVVFDPNGAEGEEITQDMVYDVSANLTENRFGRQGYTFSGWATTAKGKAAYTDGKEVKNLTDKDGVTVRLYAVWTPTTYTVTFDPGEGTTGTMKPVKMTYGKTYTLTSVSFKRTNYTFTGWRDAETWETYANKAKVRDLLSADGGTVTLVAQWVPTEYAITYRNLSTWEQENLAKSYNVLSAGLPDEPSRPGCEFAGWFLDSSCKKPFEGFENIAKPGKLTLYPKWTGTPSKYTIHFAPGADGATGKMADKKNLVCGKDYTLAACAFKRPGWQFAGWECGSAVLDNKAKFSNLPGYLEDFASGGTVTLTAKWVKNTAK